MSPDPLMWVGSVHETDFTVTTDTKKWERSPGKFLGMSRVEGLHDWYVNKPGLVADLEVGVQPLVRKAHPKICGLSCLLSVT